eukprot:CAMPEP_0181177664 /NCGR_PEP_ID=MMETSP1096-20121128/5291_1 /TAXON_ID=156174 ORGANISM="Chrysochromulina ericina, Strain CCMP281" /NCGR_SAMPLE_ID=MMETSP1096 /ASSEMBLY_ACC=CAM_ASM_000453 /LENGTH=168 /DNA_ID=CAMNT_0023265849 /DNA_START=10 /DNA_END=513 /DNA_ORIENTATION=+
MTHIVVRFISGGLDVRRDFGRAETALCSVLVCMVLALVARIMMAMLMAAAPIVAMVMVAESPETVLVLSLLVAVVFLAPPLRLQCQVIHQPMLIPVYEHPSPAVQSHTVREAACIGHPFAMWQLFRPFLDAVVNVDHGASGPGAEIIGLVFNGAHDAISHAEAARRGW